MSNQAQRSRIMHPGALTPVAITMRRLVEQGQGLLAAVAGPRLHDQVLPNTTFAEAWSAGAASFFVSPQEIEVRRPACCMPRCREPEQSPYEHRLVAVLLVCQRASRVPWCYLAGAMACL